jgi:hypothetical protein
MSVSGAEVHFKISLLKTLKTGLNDNVDCGLRPDRHGVMEDIVGIVTLFDLLKEGIKFSFAVIKLRPEGIGEHICVGIVDVAALVLSVVPRSSFVVLIGVGAGI